MIIVTLVATLAAAMVWQQWRAVQVESAERARTQSAWILSGALELGRIFLREDQKSGAPTALTEPWATPLAEARLSTILGAEKSGGDDIPEVFLSGFMTDALSRYNLTNLVIAAVGADREAQVKVLETLCQTLGIDTDVAGRIATGLQRASAAQSKSEPDAAAPLLPRTVGQLSWLGIDEASLKALQPYIVLLPEATPVNINTAPKEVLLAVIPGLDQGSAERLIQVRQRTAFADRASIEKQIPGIKLPPSSVDIVRSKYFIVTGRARLADHVLTERSLVRRVQGPASQFQVLWREPVSTLEQARQ
jgi:general secretion pathway protein K